MRKRELNLCVVLNFRKKKKGICVFKENQQLLPAMLGKCGRRQWYYACQVLNWELWTRFMAKKRLIFVSDVNCMLSW